MEPYRLPQTAAVGLDDVAPFRSNFLFPMGQEAVVLCPKMVAALGALVVMVGAMKGGPPSEDHTDSLDEMWIRAEEDYGLVRPEPGETMIAVHRQTSQRLAHAPDTWDEIPVHVGMPPEAILSDIAYWDDATWWLCRVHESSRSSRQPVLALTNYVLVQGDDFLMAGHASPWAL